jgi:4-hydroxyphenylpyruvate dioxygenase
MSDFLTTGQASREPWQASFNDAANPIGLDGVEFVEYSTAHPQALGQVLEMMGFQPIARHRSREVLLYRQDDMNVVVNAHLSATRAGNPGGAVPCISAVALRVRDARAAYDYVIERGAWAVPTRAEVMELHIPAIHGAGGSRIYFVDRYKEFSIYDVDFVPIPTVNQHPPSTCGIHFFGIVQYIGPYRSYDWMEFYKALFGSTTIPDEERFGIMPKGKLLRLPALTPSQRFIIQLIEPEPNVFDASERLQRIGLGVPDVHKAVAALSNLGIEFVENDSIHTETRGAITKTYLGSVVFELVHSQRPGA